MDSVLLFILFLFASTVSIGTELTIGGRRKVYKMLFDDA